MWLRETSIHSKLSAGGLPTIVQLLGLDARLHSLYLEDIATPSLAHRAWRRPDDYFSGTPTNARRVLDDMASALAFVTTVAVTVEVCAAGRVSQAPLLNNCPNSPPQTSDPPPKPPSEPSRTTLQTTRT
jgi:hypothetical protein